MSMRQQDLPTALSLDSVQKSVFPHRNFMQEDPWDLTSSLLTNTESQETDRSEVNDYI